MKKLKLDIKNYLFTIIGGILVGFAVGWFLIPLKLNTGGFGGIATIIYYVFDLPAGLVLFLLNIPLFLIATKTLGIKYSIKSFIAMAMQSIAISISGTFNLIVEDLLLASVYGGAIMGLGMGLCLRANSTTGGTDLVAKLIHAKFPHLNLGQILFLIDAFIVIISSIIFKDYALILYSILSIFIMTKSIDVITAGAEYSKSVIIISNKAEEISDYIINELNKSATQMEVKGMYSGEPKKALYCVLKPADLPNLKTKIKQIDNKAFVTITTITEIMGEWV